MKMIHLILMMILFMLVSGCAFKAMTNDEIIAEIQKCEKAGMRAEYLMDGFRDERILCLPKETL